MDLSEFRVFSNLNPTQLDNFVSACTEHHFKEDDKIITQGDHGTSVFFLLEGKLRVTLPGPPIRELAVLTPPAVVGEMEFLSGNARSATVTATTEVRCLSIPFDVLRTRVSDGDPATLKVIYNIAVVLSQRLSATLGQLEAMESEGPRSSEDLFKFRQKLYRDWSF